MKYTVHEWRKNGIIHFQTVSLSAVWLMLWVKRYFPTWLHLNECGGIYIKVNTTMFTVVVPGTTMSLRSCQAWWHQDKWCVSFGNAGRRWPVSHPGLRQAPACFHLFPAARTVSAQHRCFLLELISGCIWPFLLPEPHGGVHCGFFLKPRCSIFNTRFSLPSGRLWS